jgi:hypothetical protein
MFLPLVVVGHSAMPSPSMSRNRRRSRARRVAHRVPVLLAQAAGDAFADRKRVEQRGALKQVRDATADALAFAEAAAGLALPQAAVQPAL